MHPELVDAPKEIIRGFHYIQSARPEWALDIAVRILQVDPTSIAAHRLYIYAMLEHRQADLVWAEPDRARRTLEAREPLA